MGKSNQVLLSGLAEQTKRIPKHLDHLKDEPITKGVETMLLGLT
ncbi:hypothetical protein [Acanthopleuribacter pedis]|nr:hypothetical protein [Acanthopleuribacter pedis]